LTAQEKHKQQLTLAAVLNMFRLLRVRWPEMVLLTFQTGLYAVLAGAGALMLAPVLQYVQRPASFVQPSGVFKYLVDFIHFLHMPANLVALLILAFIPVVFQQVVYFWNTWYTATVSQRAVTRLRSDGLDAVLHSDLSFVVHESPGKLVATLYGQVGRAGTAITQFVNQIGSGLTIVAYVAVLLVLSWPLALIATAAMLLISLLVKTNVTRSRAFGAEAAALNSKSVTAMGDRMSAIRVIKMRGQEEVERARLTEIVRDMEVANVKISVAKAGLQVTVDPTLMLVMFGMVYVGVQYLGVSLAALGLFLFVLLRLNSTASSFNVGRQTWGSNYDSLLIVHSLLDRANAARTIVGGSREFTGLAKSIEFEDVSFCYGDDGDQTMVLSHVDATIPKGSVTAFVGRSGAGKSTLVDLIPHLREATSGEIRIDGVPIREFDLRSLRRHIGFMTQEAILFNDTVYANLCYGLERVPTDEEVQRALEGAYCTDFIAELPLGLETQVGDRGVRLSGGQRQRLALAGVLLQDPDILILDEPTSSLDSESEKYIQKALDDMRAVRTLVVIAHRLSTVQRADEIFVVDHGVIVERGTHEELLQNDAAYHRLFELQIHA
jgi:ABC-type multidrug transport system fused ATPase/permease subunit